MAGLAMGFLVPYFFADVLDPGGLALVGAVLWRGLIYGAADGLLLSAFPILAVFAAAAGSPLRTSRSGTVALHSYDTETFLPPHR